MHTRKILNILIIILISAGLVFLQYTDIGQGLMSSVIGPSPVESKQAEIDANEAEKISTEKALEDIEAKITEIESTITDTEDEIDPLLSAYEEAREEYGSGAEALNTYKKQALIIIKKTKQLKENRADTQSIITELTRKIAETNTLIMSGEASAEAVDMKAKKIRIDALTASLAKNQKNIRSIITEIIKLRKEFTELKSDIDLEKVTVAPLQRSLARTNDELEDKKSELESIKRTLSELNIKKNELEQKLTNLGEKGESLDAELVELEEGENNQPTVTPPETPAVVTPPKPLAETATVTDPRVPAAVPAAATAADTTGASAAGATPATIPDPPANKADTSPDTKNDSSGENDESGVTDDTTLDDSGDAGSAEGSLPPTADPGTETGADPSADSGE